MFGELENKFDAMLRFAKPVRLAISTRLTQATSQHLRLNNACHHSRLVLRPDFSGWRHNPVTHQTSKASGSDKAAGTLLCLRHNPDGVARWEGAVAPAAIRVTVRLTAFQD